MWKTLDKNERDEYKKMILAFASLTEMFAQKADETDNSGMRTKSWTPKRGDLWHIQSNKLLQH